MTASREFTKPDAVIRRRRRRRRILDVLVLLAIVGVGGLTAFGAAAIVMPTRSPGPAGGSSVDRLAASSDGATGSSASQAPSGAPDSSAAGAAASSAPGMMAASAAAPWLAWRPVGRGSVTAFRLPAPWTGGTQTSIAVYVYLPPGYAASGRSYPVIYEAPFSYASWRNHMPIESILDAQFTSGAAPASIVVFVYPSGGPYHDTECVNSLDGRQKLDTFLSRTLVHAVDARFRTIPTAAARATLGFSQGGYCAAMLALRHPDVFSAALSFSGYYQAGVRNAETRNAWRPFGGQPSLEAAYSPLTLVGKLAPAHRSAMLLVLEADPAQPFFGPQYTAMLLAAHAAGVTVVAIPQAVYHSWAISQLSLPRAFRALAAHEVGLGVFG